MNSKVWMVASLVIICLLSAFALSKVYLVTQPRIEKQKREAVNIALSQVLPQADSFKPVIPDTLWYGLDKNGNKVGIVIKVTPRGYGGTVETLVGLNMEKKVTGIRIASPAEGLHETPGLGLKSRNPDFRNQFKGKTATEIRLKRDGGTIDAISAATITSRAVTEGVRKGIEKYSKYLKP
ncbi:hypothetical protein CH330_03250 [candidate division WOR-3 bacterium JGI_Cruoil_03_51_56]|uniref:Ion-translocating oxidoreductase complex subunit G n=1 Tax=candidate division WOR-3 bacterium JGI_Cruoil_03_51_56 TaxID=1973747 RepID=A0A235BWY9_UNCW3|nr:MAG: hypothetical protein CH330_03250 [candidate division WOR-3 bacterium JGI_Cruoil_03_51_56]